MSECVTMILKIDYSTEHLRKNNKTEMRRHI